MPNDEYWEERFLLLNELLLQKGEEYIKNAAKDYAAAILAIEKEINDFYARFADENAMTLQQAKQVLTTSERQAFQMELDDYIKYGQMSNLDPVWIKKLENASTVHRVTRLQAISYQFQQQVEKLEAKKVQGMTDTLKGIYKESHYRTAYEIQKGTGIGQAFSKIDENRIEKVIAKPWAPDGKNFSERVWGQDRTQLLYQLETRFTQGIIRGEAPQKIIADMSKALNSSRKATERLVLTESAFVSAAAQKESFEKLGVKKYRVLATLDLKTSEICRKMDGKVFDMQDFKIGVTSYPFHPRCRSTNVPYIDDKYRKDQQRAARDKNGKTCYVPADMNYEEWHKTYVEADPEWLLQEKMLKNKNADKKQYEQYKKALGKKEVGTFDSFQKMKYNDSEKWDSIKKRKREEMGRNDNLQKTRTQEELQKSAENMKVLAEEYSIYPSKWSGKIIVKKSLPRNTLGEKEWSCDIVMIDHADNGVILHEMLHSCSSSHYDETVFLKNQFIEEASTEFLKQQICKEKNIKSVKGYIHSVKILEYINKSFRYGTDLEFAKELFNIPLPERYEWLRNKVDKSLKQENASFEEHKSVMEFLGQLEGGEYDV